MSRYMFSAAVVGAIALAGLGADLKSGLEPGKTVSVFNPLNVNGPDAGEKRCQI